MPSPNPQKRFSDKLNRHLTYLEADPENTDLLIDTADIALTSQEPEIALELLDRYSGLTEETVKSKALRGLALLQSKEFGGASSVFVSLVQDNPDDLNARYNLAWCLAMEQKFDQALSTLTPPTCTSLPQAAALEIELRHQVGDFDGAQDVAKLAMDSHPDDQGVNAAVSVLAMDTDQADLAMACAKKAGSHPDALTTLGTLTLGEDNPGLALEQFDAALRLNKHRPRAWLGRGLALIASGKEEVRQEAAQNIDHGARMFETHIGSWIAAGWVKLMMNDRTSARKRFETAMAIDTSFSESHGALAVIDVLEGRFEAAQSGIRRAIGLDRECFSAALAQVLLLQSDGKTDMAQRVFDRAVHTPMDETGRTIADTLVKQGLTPSTIGINRT